MKSCGRTKIFELRPENMIEVGGSRAHNLCVCKKHENVKLMVDAISTSVEKTLLVDKLVCDIRNGECILARCQNCPGKDILSDHVMRMVDGLEDQIKLKQWKSTDRNILLEKKTR
jgi:hypothetical protein